MKKLLVLMLALVLLITAGCSTNEPPTVVEPETSNPEVDEPLEDDVKDETVIVDPETVRLTVSGYVRDDEGKGIADLTVELHSEVKTTVTDKNGLFVFEDVEEGDHKLTVLDKNGKIMATYSLNLKADPSKNESSLTENNGSYSAVLSATLKLEMTVILGENGASSLNHGDYKPEPKPESKPEQKPENKPSAKPDDKKDEDEDKGHDVVIVKPGSGSTRPNRPTHTHTYKTEWSGDANYHWHDASCGHTDLVSDKAAHTEEIIPAKAPTCKETGLTEGKKCSVCGKILVAQQEVAVTEDHVAVDVAEVPATCTEKGTSAGKKCSVCDKVLSGCEEIPTVSHTAVVDPAVDATCTTAGKTTGSHCSVCGEVIVAQQTVEALGHTEEIIPAVDATCTEGGKTAGKKCAVCDEILVAQTDTEANGHTEEIVSAVPATCIATGLTEGKKCSVCDAVLVAQTETEKLDHAYPEAWTTVTPATCTEKGSEKKVCTICDQDTITQEIEMLGHSYDNGVETTPATCIATGVKTYSCTREGCDKSYTVTIQKTEHTWDEGTSGEDSATCGAYVLYKCKVENCTAQNKVSTGVANHEFTTGKYADQGDGKHAKVCDKCNAAITTEGNVSDHTYNEGTVTTAATCTTKGVLTKTCTASDCGATETEEIPATGHNHKVTVTDPTCTVDGYTTHTCQNANCDDSYTDTPVPALGHAFGDWAHVENTKTHQRACTKSCGETGAVETENCSGTYVSVNDEKHTFTCATCKYTETVDHDYGDEEDTATWYVTTNTCEHCQHTKTNNYQARIVDGERYATVQGAIDAATATSTIEIAPGEFAAINLRKEITAIKGTAINNVPVTTLKIETAPSKQSDPGIWVSFKGTVENIVFEAANGVANNGTYGALSLNHTDWSAEANASFVNCRFINQGIKYSGKVTFENCIFDGKNHAERAFNYCIPNSDIVLDNCTISGYKQDSFHAGEVPGGKNVTVTVKNSYISGACMELGNINSLVFENTTLDCTVNVYLASTEVSFKNVTAGENFALPKHAAFIVTDLGGNNITFDFYKNAEGEYCIGTANGMFEFASLVNNSGNTFSGKTVKLLADIYLENKPWTPIGQTGATKFEGVFDGQEHTIYNLNIDSSAQTGGDYSSGLFGWIEKHGTKNDVIKNVNINGATVKGNHNVAVLAGYLIGTVENCNVTGATVTCTHANDNACGDKAGVIAGIAAETNAVIRNCTATDSTVKAGRDGGQIVGACIVGKVENCSATNVTVSATGDCTGNNINNALIGRTN